MKDEAEPFRLMAMDAIEKIVAALGVADIGGSLEEQLVDGLIFSFQVSFYVLRFWVL